MSDDKSIKPFETQRMPNNPLALVRIGDWYWVTTDDEFGDDDGNNVESTDLWCVYAIGSNYIGFRRESTDEYTHYRYFRLHIDEFEARCRREENWRDYFQKEMTRIQGEMREKMREMLEEGQSLALLPPDKSPEEEAEESLLPVRATMSPEKYKTDLVAFRDERMPVLQKEIDELAKEFGVAAKHLSLPDLLKLKHMQGALEVVEDRIFTVELYCGMQETVHQIAEGEPAGMEEPIHIRQQLLFMDEETLFDYDDGGMDFQKLEQFDEWVVKPENLNRIAPESKCIVGFRVRRHEKDYGTPSNLIEAWTHVKFHEYNFETYLLIRNGQKVYRIATPVKFDPRLVPFEDEIGEAQFKKIHRSYNWKKGDDDVTEEKITPDNVEYDDHVKKMEDLIRHYNRIIILLQGLLDRSKVFWPHPGIRLTKNEHMERWVKCVRDEEKALPANRVTWKGYVEQINKTIRKGKKVWSAWYPEDYGRWYRDHTVFTSKEEDVIGRPRVCEIVSIRRDRSEVRIKWTFEKYVYGYCDKWGEWVSGHNKEITRYLWVPIGEVVNVSDYNIGDYKMFLCDRTLQGKYLEWAPVLLTAEDMKRIEAGRTPKNPQRGWKRSIEYVGGEPVVVNERLKDEDGNFLPDDEDEGGEFVPDLPEPDSEEDNDEVAEAQGEES